METTSSGLAAKLSKPVRLLLGVATLWPILYFVAFVGLLLFPFLSAMWQVEPPIMRTPVPPRWLAVTFVLHFGTIILGLGLLVVSIVDVFKNDRITRDMKALWAIVLFMGGFIAMPVYWYLYFWRDPK